MFEDVLAIVVTIRTREDNDTDVHVNSFVASDV